MRFTKKILTMATCAVMAASSMVGMSTSAAFSSTILEPSGNPVYLTIDGERYGFQINSTINTSTLSNGNIRGTATTKLYEVNGKTIPTEHIYLTTYLYAKNSNGQSFLLTGSQTSDTLYTQSNSCVYKTKSSSTYDDYPYYAAAGYVNISYGSIGEVKTISSSTTSYVGA